MAIPAKAADYSLAFHRLIAGNRIFYGSWHKVAEMRKPRRKRRPIIEDVLVISRTLLYRLIADIIIFPEFQDSLFHLREVGFAVNRLEHNQNSYLPNIPKRGICLQEGILPEQILFFCYPITMRMKIDQGIKALASIFRENGFSLYLVGGAVRDFLLKKENNDYDFTTDAEPKDIKAMFHRTIDTGIKHGTVTVLFKGAQYEITSMR